MLQIQINCKIKNVHKSKREKININMMKEQYRIIYGRAEHLPHAFQPVFTVVLYATFLNTQVTNFLSLSQ